jgi:Zn-dependent protease
MPFDIRAFLLWYIALIVALVCHEASHALVAMWGGDRTAYEGGQVTLNPIPHMQRAPVGTIVIPILTFWMMGFPLGFAHAPYNPYWADAHPKRAAAMSFAGPGANLLIALLLFALFKAGMSMGWFERSLTDPVDIRGFLETLLVGREGGTESPWNAIAKIASVLLSINLLLGLFNLIPIPPLDGAGVMAGLLPGQLGAFYQFLRANPTIGLVGIIIVFRFGGEWIFPIFVWVVRLLQR